MWCLSPGQPKGRLSIRHTHKLCAERHWARIQSQDLLAERLQCYQLCIHNQRKIIKKKSMKKKTQNGTQCQQVDSMVCVMGPVFKTEGLVSCAQLAKLYCKVIEIILLIKRICTFNNNLCLCHVYNCASSALSRRNKSSVQHINL